MTVSFTVSAKLSFFYNISKYWMKFVVIFKNIFVVSRLNCYPKRKTIAKRPPNKVSPKLSVLDKIKSLPFR